MKKVPVISLAKRHQHLLAIAFSLLIMLSAVLLQYFHEQKAVVIFLSAIAISGLIPSLLIYRSEDYARGLEKQIHLLQLALLEDKNLVAIVSNDKILVYCDDIDKLRVNSLIDLCAQLQLPPSVLEKLQAAVGTDAILEMSLDLPEPLTVRLSPLADHQLLVIYPPARLHRVVHDSSQIGIGVYRTDGNGVICDINEKLCRILGYDRDEIIGMPINNLLCEYEGKKARGEKVLPINWQSLINIKDKMGEEVPIIALQKALQNGEGALGYCIKLPDDSLIMKSRGVESGWLDYSWQCFFSPSPYPTTILNRHGEVLRLNSSALELLKKDIKHIKDIIPTIQHSSLDQELLRLNQRNNNKVIPIKNVRLNSGRVVDLYLGKILDLNGDLYGFMARITDMTEQHELASNFSHAQRMQTIGYLSGSIAHDFNNVLTAIIGYCDLLFLRHSINDPSFNYIMHIKQSASRAANLVNCLLSFARKQTLNPRLVNINEIFGEIHNLIRRLTGTAVELRVKVQPDLWFVRVDAVHFEQVILNLIVNAQQAITDSDWIELDISNVTLKRNDKSLIGYNAPVCEPPPPPGEFVSIRIEDSGCGISPEIYDKIFEPFFTTKQYNIGSGLGLSSCYGIIRQSGGHLLFKSEVNVGTTFNILLPRHIPTEHDKEMETTPPKVATIDTTGSGNILLVEDEEAVRLFIKSVLTNKGYSVLDYQSALEVMDDINNIGHLDLLISDVAMPGMSGPELVSDITPKYPRLKVLFISGYGENYFNETYGSKRDFNFMAKPFTIEDLAIKVKEVIA